MRAVQRVAGLEGNDAGPAFFGEQGAGLSGAEHILSVRGILGLRQDTYLAAEEHGPAVAHDHATAGVIGPLGLIDALNVLGFVVREDVVDVQRADEGAGAVDELYFLAALERGGGAFVDGEGNGNRPRVALTVTHDHAFVEAAVP